MKKKKYNFGKDLILGILCAGFGGLAISTAIFFLDPNHSFSISGLALVISYFVGLNFWFLLNLQDK